MDINGLCVDAGEDVYYDKGFYDVLEAHIEFLRNSEKTRIMDVESKKTEIYLMDLYGFLTEMKIPAKYHWLTMRINRMYSPFDFLPGVTKLLIADYSDVEKIRASYMSTTAMSV